MKQQNIIKDKTNINAKNQQINDCEKQIWMLREIINQY